MSERSEDLGQLLEAYRPFLLALAEAQLDSDLRPKVSPSDLVQDTILEAGRDFQRARFETDQQLEAWLRALLLNNLADARRRFRHAAKRDVRRERSVQDSRVQQLLDRVANTQFVQSTRDDGRQAARDRVARALKRLPREKRMIIIWVHLNGRSLHDVSRRVEKSYDATRVFLKRSLKQLKDGLERDDERPDAAT